MAGTLSKGLSKPREVAGLSGRELDRLSGLGEGHTRMIETGDRTRLEVETAQKLATTLGTSIDWLVFGNGDPPKPGDIAAAVQAARSRAA